MTRREISRHITHRLAEWQEDMERLGAIPLLMLAITQDDRPEGERSLILANRSIDEGQIRSILTDTLICLRRGDVVDA
jgi:hypothetical protein